MNREQFLRELSDRLKALPESERSIALDYYSELISDRMEDGMTEEEAVAALGSVDQIVREAAPESDRTRVAHRTTATDGETVTITTPVRSLKADCSCAEISVSSGSLPDGTTARIEYCLPENGRCKCNMQGNRLEIYYAPRRHSFSLWELFQKTSATIRVTLSDPALDQIEMITSSGDIALSHLHVEQETSVSTSSGEISLHNCELSGDASIGSSSGDITLHALTCGALHAHASSGSIDLQHACISGDCAIESQSGDATLVELQCGGELRGNSTSGDLDLRNVNAARISIQSTSGDVTARNLICPTLTANSTSGDVEIEDVASASTLAASSKSGDVSLMCFEDWDTIKLQSTSGDLELREVSARHIILSTVSGDISGTLSGSAGQYDFRAWSVSGDVSVPLTRGQRLVEINSVSGDITLTAQ